LEDRSASCGSSCHVYLLRLVFSLRIAQGGNDWQVTISNSHPPFGGGGNYVVTVGIIPEGVSLVADGRA
jgi:hypothetical protein